MKITTSRSRIACVFAAFSVLGAGSINVTARAQTTHHHRSFAQKHPTATGVGVGVGAYALAKHTGKNRARAGRRPNFAQRHPVVTGVVAGMAAHHMAKKHSTSGK